MQCTVKSDSFPRGTRAAIVRRYPVFLFSCVQCFRVSVIYRTLTWTAWSLTCVCDHSYACVYTRELGTQTTSQHNILTRKNFSVDALSARDGIERALICSQVGFLKGRPFLLSLLMLVCKQLLTGIVYSLAAESTPRTGSGSPKGSLRSSRLPFVGALHYYLSL